jgi:hypothetical protein
MGESETLYLTLYDEHKIMGFQNRMQDESIWRSASEGGSSLTAAGENGIIGILEASPAQSALFW